MLTILKAVLEACREERGDIPKFAEELRREVETWHSPAPGELEREVQLELLTALASSFDAEYGGFGGAPKFPPITQLELLLMRSPACVRSSRGILCPLATRLLLFS